MFKESCARIIHLKRKDWLLHRFSNRRFPYLYYPVFSAPLSALGVWPRWNYSILSAFLAARFPFNPVAALSLLAVLLAFLERYHVQGLI